MNRTLWPPTFYFRTTGNIYFLQNYYNHSMLLQQTVFAVMWFAPHDYYTFYAIVT